MEGNANKSADFYSKSRDSTDIVMINNNNPLNGNNRTEETGRDMFVDIVMSTTNPLNNGSNRAMTNVIEETGRDTFVDLGDIRSSRIEDDDRNNASSNIISNMISIFRSKTSNGDNNLSSGNETTKVTDRVSRIDDNAGSNSTYTDRVSAFFGTITKPSKVKPDITTDTTTMNPFTDRISRIDDDGSSVRTIEEGNYSNSDNSTGSRRSVQMISGVGPKVNPLVKRVTKGPTTMNPFTPSVVSDVNL